MGGTPGFTTTLGNVSRSSLTLLLSCQFFGEAVTKICPMCFELSNSSATWTLWNMEEKSTDQELLISQNLSTQIGKTVISNPSYEL